MAKLRFNNCSVAAKRVGFLGALGMGMEIKLETTCHHLNQQFEFL